VANYAPPVAAVILRPNGSVATTVIELRGRLGDRFDAYRECCERAGARTRKLPTGAWETTLPTTGAPKLVGLLGEVGIRVEVDAALKTALDAAAHAALASVIEGDARLAAADAALAPTGRSLRAYQREGVKWLCARSAQGAILADDMGCGKTAQVLVALPTAPRVLVICPAVAKGVWRREVAKWRADVRVTVLSGRGSLTRWPEPGEMVVVNYDVLPGEMPTAPHGVVVVADEAHALKNAKSTRTEKFRAIGEAARAAGGRVWLVTATPLTNRAPELWSVLRCAGLEKEAFRSWDAFKQLFDGREGRFGMDWGTSISPEVPALLRRVLLRRDKRDVAKDLPAKSREVVTVELEREGLKLVEAEIKALLRDGQSVDDLLEEIEHGGVAFATMARLRAALAGAKLPAVLALVEDHEEAGEPLVVFSAHRAVVDALGARPGWGRISGDETAEEKSAVEDAFQAGTLKGVAATIKAGGVAITLTRACRALFADQAWTPADNCQAEDRIYRIGQTRPVLITVLQAEHPVDARVTDLLLTKTVMYERSVGASRLQAGEVDTTVIAATASVESTPVQGERVELPPPPPSRPSRRLYWRGETCADADLGDARAPATAAEHWVLEALAQLCADDPDRAREKNGIGWSQSDGRYGHTLLRQCQSEGLTDRGWKAALLALRPYHKQVGKAPKE
jgi:hypothetical protein